MDWTPCKIPDYPGCWSGGLDKWDPGTDGRQPQPRNIEQVAGRTTVPWGYGRRRAQLQSAGQQQRDAAVVACGVTAGRCEKVRMSSVSHEAHVNGGAGHKQEIEGDAQNSKASKDARGGWLIRSARGHQQ
ncbi:hypothetical protein P154DRAFT_581024 [Amniculicola lignicola CBS 123094]|uniref:Uncharacterized protein n=1 Tax=Amniculicola lignicola CBS 123094 TaxID=1392246 RepID=A0A6A5W016_9PLEO|nr:hypothetical protein P154DRAFT_581024 [Amniculicola lignicola CBS 123094]